MKQKFVLIVLVFALALSLTPAVFALDDAEGTLTTGGNIKLTGNLTLAGDLTIERDTVLDLNGFTITGTQTGTEDEKNGVYTVSRLTVAEGAKVTIKDGRLLNINIDNYGQIDKLTDLKVISPKSGEVIRNWNTITEISRCIIQARRSAIRDVSGKIALIDNCDISVDLMVGVIFGGNSGLMRHCRVISTDTTWGVATAGGKGAVRIDDCVLVGYSRGAMIANGGNAQISNSTLINLSTAWGVSKTCAVWLEGENADAMPPHLENCTVIAAEGSCGYGVLETTTETVVIREVDNLPVYGEVEHTDWVYHEKADMTNCTFIPLSQAGSISQFTNWVMESAPDAPNTPPEPSLENFTASNDYTPGQFTDVSSTYWAGYNVAKVYELGLMKGNSTTTFNPAGNISLAHAIAIAARLNSIYTTGSEAFVQGDVWYQTYLDYLTQNKLLTKTFENYSRNATRAEFAAILAAALPDEALTATNIVLDGAIPDVDMNDADAAAIYVLYRAGVLTGNDASGTFTPNSSITRAAAAAIVTRMADTDLRKSITLTQ